MLVNFLLQINVAGNATEIPAVQQATELNLSLWELAVKGGITMIPIAILSLIAVYIFFDRFLAIRKVSKNNPAFMNTIKENIVSNKIDSAISLCKATNTPVARMIEKGICRIGRPLNDINAAIENVGKLEIAKLEKNLATLATVAGVGPMLGFLGTVTGMVSAFHDMSVAGNNIDIQLLSSGIYEAMVTTVAGLVVGILAFLAYNFLTAKINNLVNHLETTSTEFMDLLNEPVK